MHVHIPLFSDWVHVKVLIFDLTPSTDKMIMQYFYHKNDNQSEEERFEEGSAAAKL